MTPFIYTFCYTFFKLLILSGITEDKLFIKICIIIILMIGLGLYCKYYKPIRFANVQEMIDKHNISDKRSRYIVIMIVLLYFILCIICVLFLKIYNSYNPPNLYDIYIQIYNILILNDVRVNLINFTLCLLFIVIYILVLSKLFKYFKLNIIKLHIYYSKDSSYYVDKWPYIQEKIRYQAIHQQLYNIVWLNKFIFGFNLSYHIVILIKIMPYISLLLAFVYDNVYNSSVLIVTYKILPYIFLYQLYLNFCEFYKNSNSSFDIDVHNLIYLKKTVLNGEIIVDNEMFDREYIHNLMFIYLGYNLSFWHYYYIGEKNQLLRFNYILDWNLRKRSFED